MTKVFVFVAVHDFPLPCLLSPPDCWQDTMRHFRVIYHHQPVRKEEKAAKSFGHCPTFLVQRVCQYHCLHQLKEDGSHSLQTSDTVGGCPYTHVLHTHVMHCAWKGTPMLSNPHTPQGAIHISMRYTPHARRDPWRRIRSSWRFTTTMCWGPCTSHTLVPSLLSSYLTS